MEQDRGIVVSGLKGYEKKLEDSKRPGGRKLHQGAGDSEGERRKKKLMGKSNWFRNSKMKGEFDDKVTQLGRTGSSRGSVKMHEI